VVLKALSRAADPQVAAKMAAGQIGWTTVTSSAAAAHSQNCRRSLRTTKSSAISPVTSATIRELGYQPSAEAKEYTMAGV